MNKAAAFDIRRYIRHLTESGFTEQQAEEHLMLLNENLASKDNLARVEASLKDVHFALINMGIVRVLDLHQVEYRKNKCPIESGQPLNGSGCRSFFGDSVGD